MFAEMRAASDDPAVVFHEYSAVQGDDISSSETWHKGNPGLLAGIKSSSYMESRARLAKRTPDDLASFRVYELNMRQSAGAGEVLVDVDDWLPCEVEVLPSRAGACFVGIDLGGSASMTAAAAYWPLTSRFEVWAAFPEVPELKDRGESDGVGSLYECAFEEGQLLTVGRRIVDVPAFIDVVFSDLQSANVEAVGADRFRMAETQQRFEESEVDVDLTWAWDWGLGYG